VPFDGRAGRSGNGTFVFPAAFRQIADPLRRERRPNPRSGRISIFCAIFNRELLAQAQIGARFRSAGADLATESSGGCTPFGHARPVPRCADQSPDPPIAPANRRLKRIPFPVDSARESPVPLNCIGIKKENLSGKLPVRCLSGLAMQRFVFAFHIDGMQKRLDP
jgi:hypothetical protein